MILGGEDGPVLVVDARSAFILRDALRRWLADHQRHGARQKTAAVRPLLEEWERVADLYAATLTRSARGPLVSADPTTSATVVEDRMSTAKAASALSCTERHVCRLIAKGDLPAQRLGRDWLIEPADVRVLLALRKTA